MYSNFIKTYSVIDKNEWQNCLELPNLTYEKVYSLNGYFYTFSSNKKMFKTVNGILWYQEDGEYFTNIKGIATVTGRFEDEKNTTEDNITYRKKLVYHQKTIIITGSRAYCTFDMKNIEHTTRDGQVNYPQEYLETTVGLCSHNNILYAGTSNGYILISRDAGFSWEIINLGVSINSIDTSLSKVFIGTNNGLYVSIDDGEFEKFIDEYEIIPENFNGRILAATQSGMCYVTDNTSIYLTDMEEQTEEISSTGDLGNIYDIIIDNSNGCYISTTTGLWYNTNEVSPLFKKVLDDTYSQLGIIFYHNNNIISMKKRQYYRTNVKSQLDVYTTVLSASKTSKETIIKQITIANENDNDATYYIGNTELDGTGLISCALSGEGIAYDGDNTVDLFHLIPPDYELDTNSIITILDKPLILNKNESIVFKSKTPKVSITVIYSYGG